MHGQHFKRIRVNAGEGGRLDYHYYVAPLYKAYEFGFIIKFMQSDSGRNAMVPVHQELVGIKRKLDELQSSDKSTVEEAPVISVATKFFYSREVYDYSAGEGTKALNAAAMHPANLGTHGKHIMRANNSHAHAQIRTFLSDKYNNLHNHLNEHLHVSIVFRDEKKKQNLHALAPSFFKSYEIPITENRLKRLALLLIKQSEASAAGKQKTDLFIDTLLKKDTDKYGDYTFKEKTEDAKAEKVIDQYVGQAYPKETKGAASGSRTILGDNAGN
ncbi:unnamed protein product [Tilletia controversa]|nr:unnamed protein product [Tilletia controversa]